ncbi:ras and EF-hand domain-containing protein homolog isoform X2 [Venturia canescens]|uniref:ras and EF-hand domain-containing protein homolog isoform X2 n=1 Tax=Venturia canescens TaxID=32260 RepID=UPI001C9C4C83|nr:ras and EF-hand domain-containing protein homolog isoform X2 [Venturia canescens]
MERNDDSSRKSGGSSPDTVIGPSSSEEDDKARCDQVKIEATAGIGDSSSSLDTVIAGGAGRYRQKIDRHDQPCEKLDRGTNFIVGSLSSNAIEEVGKKKGRFGAIKNTFRKIKRSKSKSIDSAEIYGNFEYNDAEGFTGSVKRSSEEREEEKRSLDEVQAISSGTSAAAAATGKKKKKRNSLVRKLSLNKFRLGSSEHQHQQPHQQEHHLRESTRQTPEGGDSSRSQSQSSHESSINTDSASPRHQKNRHQSREADNSSNDETTLEKRRSPGDRRDDEAGRQTDVSRSTNDREKGSPISNQQIQTSRGRHQETTQRPHHRHETKPYEKTLSTVTTVIRKSPSLTIRTNLQQKQQERDVTKSPHGVQESEKQQPTQETLIQCSVSTLPYAISKWHDQSKGEHQQPVESSRKSKFLGKSDSESTATAPTTPPIELRRKLSLLEEKRAIFQRRRYETSQDSSCDISHDTVVAASLGSTRKDSCDPENTVKRARHISVRKFDTFSTFEGTFDEDTGVGYLAGIEEVHSENYLTEPRKYGKDKKGTALVDEYEEAGNAMQQPGNDNAEGSTSLSQESVSSQNNAPNTGIGEKREHLYKILVIGELGAGKTSIIKRYVHQFFSQHYRATIGVDFALKVLNWDPHTIIRLQLWDIAGQERFGNMTRVYYKEAVGAFIVFDVTRSATLEAVVKWKQDLDSKVQLPDGSPIPCVLLANKCDQQKEGLVNTPSKMDDYCKEKNFSGWFETSAKENINIEEAARFLVKKILQNDQIMKGNGSQDQTDGERFALNQSPTSSKKSCPC